MLQKEVIFNNMPRKRRRQRERERRSDSTLTVPAAPTNPKTDRVQTAEPVSKKKKPVGNLWETQVPVKDQNLVLGSISENFLLDKVDEEDDECNMTPVSIKVCQSLKSHIEWWKALPQDICPKSIIQIIDKGIFIKLPSNISHKYKEKNNRSCLDNLSFAREAVQKWLMSGAVEQTTEDQLKAVNPMTVAFNRSGKPRLCIDMSRHVNLHTPKRPFRLIEMQRFASTVQQGDYQFGFDLKSAYHHLVYREESRPWVGFCIPTEDGIDRFYHFVAMMFGWGPSMKYLGRATRPLIVLWRRQKILCFIWVDDGHLIARTLEDAKRIAAIVRKDLAEAGWVVDYEDKCYGFEGSSDPLPRQRAKWVGFIWDTVKFRIELPDEKLNYIMTGIQKLLENRFKSVKLKQVASTIGQIQAAGPAIGAMSIFRTRSNTILVAATSEERGWRSSVRLKKEQIQELEFWFKNLPKLAKRGQLIRRPASALKIRGQKISSDSGKYELACCWFSAQHTLEVKNHVVEFIPEEEQGESSTHRELLAVRQGLRKWAKELKGQVVTWLLDNQAAVKILKWGSMRPKLMALALEINTIVEEADIEIIPVWKDRTASEIAIADKMGRGWNTNVDEYRISSFQFEEIVLYYGSFKTDLFSSNWSARTPQFVTKEPTTNSFATNAFTISWSHELIGRAWIHPPIMLLQKVLEKVLAENVSGMIIFPWWENNFEVSQVMNTIVDNGDRCTVIGYTYLHCESPAWRIDSAFRGYTNFPFVMCDIYPMM